MHAQNREGAISTSTLRAVVSNTGPLISALQCGQMDILRQLYDLIHIPASEMPEYEEHGARQEIRALIEAGFIEVHDDLTASEREAARKLAEEIARSTMSKDKEPSHHYPEAEAMVLMDRAELQAMELLLDELAAREVAQRRGIDVVGFPGILIRACQRGLIEPEDVRDALFECQRQGTHYATAFIEEIYARLRRF